MKRMNVIGLALAMAATSAHHLTEALPINDAKDRHDKHRSRNRRHNYGYGKNTGRYDPTVKVPSRNEPCYCGSGEKYKKCCIGKKPSRTQKEGETKPSSF